MSNEDFSGPRVLVDFWAEWCGPCKMTKPILEKFDKDNPDIKVIFCNVDKEKDLANHYGIRSIPTLMYFEDGEIKGKRIGSASEGLINELVANNTDRLF